MVEKAEQVADLLEKHGVYASVINARFVKPLDEDLIVNLGRDAKLLVSLEENTIHGGFGSGVLEILVRIEYVFPHCRLERRIASFLKVLLKNNLMKQN